VVETQIGLERLLAEGLERDDAVHAIGSVLAKYLYGIMLGGATGADPNAGHWNELASDSGAASRMSACVARGCVGDRLDVSEGAASVPGREGSYEPRWAVELDAALAGGLGPAELAGVPLDEGFGVRRDAKVLRAGVRLADLGLSELDEEPVALGARAAADVEADDDASIREPVPAERVAHRPQGHEGVEVLGRDLEPTRTPLAERLADREQLVAGGRERVVVPAPVGLGCRLDDPEPLELLEPL
jgi:hypothetical protein